MMEILRAKYINDGVKLFFKDGSDFILPNLENTYEHTSLFKEWVANGGAIESEFTDAELLQQSKDTKLIAIDEEFTLAESTPINYLGNSFNGGSESASSIDKYVRLNRLAGLANHTIWDINNANVSMSDSEADELLLAIGSASSTSLFTRKDKRKAVSLVSLDALEADNETLKYPTLQDALEAVKVI